MINHCPYCRAPNKNLPVITQFKCGTWYWAFGEIYVPTKLCDKRKDDIVTLKEQTSSLIRSAAT